MWMSVRNNLSLLRRFLRFSNSNLDLRLLLVIRASHMDTRTPERAARATESSSESRLDSAHFILLPGSFLFPRLGGFMCIQMLNNIQTIPVLSIRYKHGLVIRIHPSCQVLFLYVIRTTVLFGWQGTVDSYLKSILILFACSPAAGGSASPNTSSQIN